MAVLKADPEYRRKAVFVYLSMVTSGVALIAVVIHWGIPALEGYLESHLKEQRFEEALRIGQALLAALFLPLLPPAFYVYRFSRRILASGQCPPPGTKVVRDTEVLEGRAARLRAYLLMISSFGLATMALIGMFYTPYVLGRLVQQIKERAHGAHALEAILKPDVRSAAFDDDLVQAHPRGRPIRVE